MPIGYIATSDVGGVTELLEFLGFDHEKALIEFHKLYDDDVEFDQHEPEQKSGRIQTTDDDAYVLLPLFLPNDVYVKIDEQTAGITVYSDLPIHVMHIDIDNDSNEPMMLHNEEVYPTQTLMESEELFLSDEAKVVAQYQQLRVISTFHDYTIELLDEYGEIIDSHGMGDGTDGEWNAGTFGHQLDLQHQLETGYQEFLTAYFPHCLDEHGEIFDPNAEPDDEMSAMNL